MPNHVENHIEFNGDRQQIDAMLNKIKSDESSAALPYLPTSITSTTLNPRRSATVSTERRGGRPNPKYRKSIIIFRLHLRNGASRRQRVKRRPCTEL